MDEYSKILKELQKEIDSHDINDQEKEKIVKNKSANDKIKIKEKDRKELLRNVKSVIEYIKPIVDAME